MRRKELALHGDDSHSWTVDGCRCVSWHNGNEADWLAPSLPKWRVNDVITLVFDCIDVKCCKMECYLNGKSSVPGDENGVVFDNINLEKLGVESIFPALTLEEYQMVTVVFDEQNMQFPLVKKIGYRAINACNYFVSADE